MQKNDNDDINKTQPNKNILPECRKEEKKKKG